MRVRDWDPSGPSCEYCGRGPTGAGSGRLQRVGAKLPPVGLGEVAVLLQEVPGIRLLAAAAGGGRWLRGALPLRSGGAEPVAAGVGVEGPDDADAKGQHKSVLVQNLLDEIHVCCELRQKIEL